MDWMAIRSILGRTGRHVLPPILSPAYGQYSEKDLNQKGGKLKQVLQVFSGHLTFFRRIPLGQELSLMAMTQGFWQYQTTQPSILFLKTFSWR